MSRLSLLLLPALAACAMAGPAAMPAPTTIAPGTYTTTIVEADIPAGASADMRTGIVGNWEIIVHGPTHAVVRVNGREVVSAPFELQGNQITFQEDSGEYACHAVGRYSWAMSGSTLRYTRIEDSCDGRYVVLTAHPWTKQP